MERTCFKCLDEIKGCFADEDNISNPPLNATYWTTYGNYGSSVWDSNDYYLEIYICDECLRTSKATVYKVRQEIPKLVVETWNKDEKH